MLDGCRILICEDEYPVAASLEDTLVAERARILGPVATVEAALELLWSGVHIDAAVLDMNLHGERCFPIAEKLDRYQIPFVFCTGYDKAAVPDRFSHVPVLLKPVGPREVARILDAIIEKDAMKLAID